MGPGCIPGAYVVAPDDMPYILVSSAWLLAGDTPDKLLGEFQLLVVAGDVVGESSVLRLRLALDMGAGGAPIGSMPGGGCFFRCDKCFSSMLSKPSLVKGFGSTSFIPAKISHDGQCQRVHILNLPCWKYIEMSSLLMLEVIAMMGVLSNWRMR
jgi:hypothetical protein